MVEHIVIGLKIVIALLIPDVPKKVQDDEMKRVKLVEQATKAMFDLKAKGGHETMADVMARLKKQAAMMSAPGDEDDNGEMTAEARAERQRRANERQAKLA